MRSPAGASEGQEGLNPHDRHAVWFELPIVRHDADGLDLRLRDQHSIERIGVMGGESGELFGVPKCERQLEKITGFHGGLGQVGQAPVISDQRD